MAPTIAVGTTNKAKIQSVQNALDKIALANPEFANFKVVGCNVTTTVEKQPMSDLQSLEGANQRALAALESVTQSDYAVGIESGLNEIDSKWFESGWIVCISRLSAEKGIASSDRYEIRPKIVDLIKSGLELSEAIEQVLEVKGVRSNSGFSGLITNGVIDRTDSYVNAIILAFGPFISDSRIWQ